MKTFKKIQKLANSIRVKAYLADKGKGSKSKDEYMNEIIWLNNQIQEIYSTEW
jgi:hypothetical protein|tara:strand:- start:1500 stop:1658 length:159 start_codon:yes stop_codon:yes gene_type:complete